VEKNNVKWHAKETLGHETETLNFLSKTRPRLPFNFPTPRRYVNRSWDVETETTSLLWV